MQVTWDYTTHARPYLNRPDYSPEAINQMLEIAKIKENDYICDVGAGIAHLTIPLLQRNLRVVAVEPNDAMRELGIERTRDFKQINWFEGTGENTNQSDNSFDMVTFGSSFNVTDRVKALAETNRILKSKGWFACMWNHRDFSNSIQQDVENIIKNHISNYDYGSRREDQTQVIRDSKLFTEPTYIEGTILHTVGKNDWVDAWKSHATLSRQAGDSFNNIIDEISNYLDNLDSNEFIAVPYTTRIWLAQKLA